MVVVILDWGRFMLYVQALQVTVMFDTLTPDWISTSEIVSGVLTGNDVLPPIDSSRLGPADPPLPESLEDLLL